MAPNYEIGEGVIEYEVPKGWFGKEKKRLKYKKFEQLGVGETHAPDIINAIKEVFDLDDITLRKIGDAMTHTPCP
ncbi:hypothetical protein [Pyrococcus sp. ST04]|uniref:hypothetical protein n=1 Tax=Pyrococcus sp. ST04 TaxID=1183377 RepID=UPI00064FF14C|nr:hypothetical protein [Pyrococcus sp. ST04]